ncbi:hypothetical protein [Faecalimicrobium sp. JNUCC 81]
MSKQLRIINWIIGGVVTLFFLFGPMWFFDQNPYSNPYKIPVRVVYLFLIYCVLSSAYWIMHKKSNMIFHYLLIVIVYTCIAFSIIVYAAYKG